MDSDKIIAMREGGKILGALLRDLKEYVKPGMSEKEIDAWVRAEVVTFYFEMNSDLWKIYRNNAYTHIYNTLIHTYICRTHTYTQVYNTHVHNTYTLLHVHTYTHLYILYINILVYILIHI